MKIKSNTKLAIFDTFKTKGGDLTGEANRQRAIITILASNVNPAEKTRTGISQRIAKKQEIAWKNIYSGIFRDLDEILLPMEIAEEGGRLPLKRGPKALQEKGIPYYHLTKKGILIALSISEIENRENLLKEFFSKSDSAEKEFEEILSTLLMTSPNFTYSIFQKYVKAFCDNKIKELLPFDLSKLGEISDETLGIQKEILEAFLKLSKKEKEDAIRFLNKIT
jgi:predicted transcriptional regulator